MSTTTSSTEATAAQDVDPTVHAHPTDGQYVKMFVGSRRVANVPNANLIRSDTLWIQNTYVAMEERPILIGAIRVAAGGRDLWVTRRSP